MLAAVRPDSWNLPLLLHVLGAMVLFGALLVVALNVRADRRDGGGAAAATARFEFRTLLMAVLPSWLAMRVGAQWIADEENVEDPAWVGIGYMTSELGLLLIVAATACAYLAVRRATRPEGPGGLARVPAIVSIVLLAMYLVTIWAMTAKPD
jgi:hypothetical protein